jgi:hypothetical protein
MGRPWIESRSSLTRRNSKSACGTCSIWYSRLLVRKSFFENFGDEMVIANRESGLFYSLDGPGPEIWNALIAGHTGRQFAPASQADIDGAAP